MVTLTSPYSPLDRGTPVPQADQRLVLQPALTLLVILLIPCVVLLFLLNCFLIFQRLHVFNLKKRGKRRGDQRSKSTCLRNNNVGHSRPEQTGIIPSNNLVCESQYTPGSISQGLEATTVLGEGIKGSRKRPEPRASCHTLDHAREDLHTHSPCPTCMVSMPCCSSRNCWKPSSYAMGRDQVNNYKEESSYGMGFSSDQDTSNNAVPPNTPAAAPGVTPKVKFSKKKTSTQKKRQGDMFPPTPLDSKHFAHTSSIPQEDAYAYLSTSTSLPGPGLDSDFGVSAGISLHILSSDSDSCSQSWVSGMEWDYYDPCYMRRNRHRRDPRHGHHLPVMCSKQYWV